MKNKKVMKIILMVLGFVVLPIIVIVVAFNLIESNKLKSVEKVADDLIKDVTAYYKEQVEEDKGIFNNNRTMVVEFDGNPNSDLITTFDGDSIFGIRDTKIEGGVLTISKSGKIQIDIEKQLYINGYYCLNNDADIVCSKGRVSPEDLDLMKTPLILLKQKLVTSGEGLYADPEVDGRYYFRGATPENYIVFNGEDWRIMSIEADGTIKIVRDDVLNKEELFDSTGQNAWAAMSNYINGDITGLIEKNAEINVFLTKTYLKTLSNDSKYIMPNSKWMIGSAGTYNDSYKVSDIRKMENKLSWEGDIALPSKSDFIMANSNDNCWTAKDYQDNYSICKTTNYLNRTGHNNFWLLTPKYNSKTNPMYVGPEGIKDDLDSNILRGVKPVVYLKSNVKLIGAGTRGIGSYRIYE